MSNMFQPNLNNSSFTTTGGTMKTTPNANIAAPSGSTSAFNKSLQLNYTNSIFNTDKHRQMAVPTETAASTKMGLAEKLTIAMTGLSILAPIATALIAKGKATNTNGGAATGGTQPGNNTTTSTKSDVNELNTAIKNAKQNGKADELKQTIQSKQQTVTANQSKIDTMLTKPQEDVKTADTTFKTATETYDTGKKAVDTAKGLETEAGTTSKAADTALATAQKGTKSAQDAYDKATTPESKAAALVILNAAKTAENTADENQKAAAKKYDQAKSARSDAETKLKGFADALQTAKTGVDTAAKALKTAQGEQSKLNAENSKLKETITEAQASLPSYEKDNAGTSDDKSIGKDIDSGVTGNLAKTMDGMINKALAANQSSEKPASAGSPFLSAGNQSSSQFDSKLGLSFGQNSNPNKKFNMFE